MLEKISGDMAILCTATEPTPPAPITNTALINTSTAADHHIAAPGGTYHRPFDFASGRRLWAAAN
jgi:hypothetical protein